MMHLNDPREEEQARKYVKKEMANLRNDMAMMIYWLFTNLIERRF